MLTKEEQENITWEQVAAIGDDLNDYSMMNTDVMSFCPKDASFSKKGPCMFGVFLFVYNRVAVLFFS